MSVRPFVRSFIEFTQFSVVQHVQLA